MAKETKFDIRKQELFSMISKMIERDGFETLTVRSMCKELGISTGTFYHYFPEKGDIARILFSGIDRYFEDEVTEKFDEDELNNLIIFSESYGTFATLTGVEASRSISIAPLQYSAEAYLDEERSIFQVLLGVVTRGLNNGQFKSHLEPLELARMIMLLLRGYCSDWAKNNGSYDLVEEIGKFITIFAQAL